MLKPRYQSFNESVADFNRMLDGMNRIQPIERTFNDDLLDLLRDEQELVRMDNQIEHAHRVASGSGMEMSETESHSLASMHGHAANMYSQAAHKAAAKVRKYVASQNPAMVSKMQDVVKRLKHKAQEHQSLAKRHSEEESVVAESRAHDNSIMRKMRVLAGLEERVLLPRDPGVMATTRFNAGYDAMAQPFTEAKEKGYAAHEKREKKDFRKIKGAVDDLDKMHGEEVDLVDVEDQEDEVQEDKWAAAAVKRPGRLHKYFGVPEDQKIPMSKIKAAYNKLKDKGDKSKEEISLMRALALGIRFKGGDVPGGEKKKGLAGD